MANACTSISPRAPQFISEDLRVSRVIDKFAGRAKEEIPRIIPAGRAIDAVSDGRWMSQGVPAAEGVYGGSGIARFERSRYLFAFLKATDAVS